MSFGWPVPSQCAFTNARACVDAELELELQHLTLAGFLGAVGEFRAVGSNTVHAGNKSGVLIAKHAHAFAFAHQRAAPPFIAAPPPLALITKRSRQRFWSRNCETPSKYARSVDPCGSFVGKMQTLRQDRKRRPSDARPIAIVFGIERVDRCSCSSFVPIRTSDLQDVLCDEKHRCANFDPLQRGSLRPTSSRHERRRLSWLYDRRDERRPARICNISKTSRLVRRERHSQVVRGPPHRLRACRTAKLAVHCQSRVRRERRRR